MRLDEMPDNYDFFSEYEQERERNHRLHKRLAHEEELADQMEDEEYAGIWYESYW